MRRQLIQLIVYKPIQVFDNGPGGYGHDRVKEYWQQFSPLHNITKDTPPTLGLFGEKGREIGEKIDEMTENITIEQNILSYYNSKY